MGINNHQRCRGRYPAPDQVGDKFRGDKFLRFCVKPAGFGSGGYGFGGEDVEVGAELAKVA